MRCFAPLTTVRFGVWMYQSCPFAPSLLPKGQCWTMCSWMIPRLRGQDKEKRSSQSSASWWHPDAPISPLCPTGESFVPSTPPPARCRFASGVSEEGPAARGGNRRLCQQENTLWSPPSILLSPPPRHDELMMSSLPRASVSKSPLEKKKKPQSRKALLLSSLGAYPATASSAANSPCPHPAGCDLLVLNPPDRLRSAGSHAVNLLEAAARVLGWSESAAETAWVTLEKNPAPEPAESIPEGWPQGQTCGGPAQRASALQKLGVKFKPGFNWCRNLWKTVLPPSPGKRPARGRAETLHTPHTRPLWTPRRDAALLVAALKAALAQQLGAVPAANPAKKWDLEARPA